MPDPSYDQLSSTTLSDMRADVVFDEFFVDGAGLRLMRTSGVLDEFLGGLAMSEVFQYGRVQGGAHQPGSSVTVVQTQILARLDFAPKEYLETVTDNMWQNGVINSGPNAKVKIIDAYMSNAVQSLNTDLNIDMYRHGQPAGTGVSDNRSKYIAGLSEFCNDGVTNSWDGNYFPTVGGQSRNGVANTTLNSIPIWLGDQNGNPGQVCYKPVLEGYFDCVQAPDIGLTNRAFFAYLLEREEPKQRFGQEATTRDTRIGLDGIKYMNAFIHLDLLCPSTKYGQILPSGLSPTTSIQPAVFTSAATPSAISNLPASTSITPGEVFFWLRMAGWRIRPTTDEEYNFNFTPAIRSQTEPDLAVMFLKAGLNLYTPTMRDNCQFYGAAW